MELRNSIIEGLPPEISQNIMTQMDAKDLLSFIQTSKHHYEVFRRYSSVIVFIIAQKKIGADLLPIAAARYQAEQIAPEIRGIHQVYDLEKTLHNFVKQSLSYQARVLMFQRERFTLKMVINMSSFHDLVLRFVKRQVKAFRRLHAHDMRFHLSDQPTSDGKSFLLNRDTDGSQFEFSQSEEARVAKAFYAYEVASVVMYGNQLAFDDSRERIVRYFWKRFAPWEHNQVNLLMRALGSAFYGAMFKQNPAEKVRIMNNPNEDMESLMNRGFNRWYDAAMGMSECYGLRRIEQLLAGGAAEIDKERVKVVAHAGFPYYEPWPRLEPWLSLESSTTLTEVSETMAAIQRVYRGDETTATLPWVFEVLSETDAWAYGNPTRISEQIRNVLGLNSIGGYVFRDVAKLEQLGLDYPTAEDMFRVMDVDLL